MISPSDNTSPSTEDSVKEYEESGNQVLYSRDSPLDSKVASPRPMHHKALTGLINSPRYDVRKSMNALPTVIDKKVNY